MANSSGTIRAQDTEVIEEPTKKQLQDQMERTRESLAETVAEIKDTVEHEVRAVKKGVSGVLDYREEFQKEPLVWSLGALSAGFALGYTVGYAHKNSKGRKQTPVIAFADSMVEELSTMGQGLVLPALDAKIKELFGFEFSELLGQMKGPKKRTGNKKAAKKKSVQKRAIKGSKKAQPKRK
ncbi:MAG TPA: hypothetical protein VJU84_16485 [Pyrinomonadaceae bacterium]|nr:hypothetical protein [Pyrinomonadaceae bacterium]